MLNVIDQFLAFAMTNLIGWLMFSEIEMIFCDADLTNSALSHYCNAITLFCHQFHLSVINPTVCLSIPLFVVHSYNPTTTLLVYTQPQPGQIYVAKFHWKMSKFLDNNPTHMIEVAWCPSHCNIKGNDRANKLAKEATQLTWNAPISTSRAFAL